MTDGGTHAVTFTGVENFTISTGSGNDTLTVADGSNVLTTDGGDDTITAGNGPNIIDGGVNNDTITAGNGVNTIYGGYGNDTIVAGDGGNTIDGGDGDDGITTGAGNDIVVAGLGDDTVITGGGADVTTVNGGIDTVDSGSGTDHLVVDFSSSTTDVSGGVTGGTLVGGYDGTFADVAGTSSVVFHGTENFTVTTGIGNDTVTTGSGNDVITTGDGNDVLDGGMGSDQLSGGIGNDTYFAHDSQAQVIENSGAGADTVYTTVTFSMAANVEGLVLQEAGGAIDATGSAGDDTIIGNSFANILNGGTGTDALMGGGGDDVLIGGAGADGMVGNVGNDTYSVDNIGDEVVESSGEGQDTAYASVSYALTANVEGLVLTETGGAINGNGNGSTNYIFGNSAANTLNGGGGNDVLNGGGGADTLVGGAGDDVLVGGTGDDLFAFAPGQFGHDIVTDFTAGDRIVIDKTLFADFADVQAHAVQSGGYTVITHDPANSLTLSSVSMLSLAAHDFLFV